MASIRKRGQNSYLIVVSRGDVQAVESVEAQEKLGKVMGL